MKIDNPLPSYIDKINKSAYNIAVNGTDNLEENIIDIIENEVGLKANLKVIQTKSEILGNIIDLKV